MELKIKCQCGVKYAFDVSAETLANPLHFVCQYCGVDSSATVNQIIQQQFASPVEPTIPTPPAQTAANRPVMPEPPATPATKATAAAPLARLTIQSHVQHPAPVASPDNLAAPQLQSCLKHPGQFTSDECVVCHKPICPKCMELFGYLCSAYCEGQAEKLKLDVPAYAGQKSRVEASYWKKVRLVSAAILVLLLALLGSYIWYYFVGSRPQVLYSIKLPPSEGGGFAQLITPDQALLRRGNELSRYDLRADKAIWSVPLIDKEQITKATQESWQRQKAQRAEWKIRRAKLKAAGRLDEDAPEFVESSKSESEELREISRWVERDLVSRVQLRLEERNIWLITPAKATLYAWDSGKAEKEIPLPATLARVLPGPDKSVLLVSTSDKATQILTRLDLASGDVKTEQAGTVEGDLAGADRPSSKSSPSLAGGGATNKTKQIKASQLRGAASNGMATAAAIRLAPARQPAMDMDPDSFGGAPGDEPAHVDLPHEGTFMVFAGENVAELKAKLLQKNFVQYKTIKDKPKVSELDKGVNAANSVAAMSELMNEMQAERTGGMRTEDESRYLVTIKRRLANGVPDWSSEVVGPAALFSLKSVDVLTAGKSVYVLDKSNKKLWESKLAFPISPGMLSQHTWFDDALATESPCVERDQTLYFFDQGVLTAFELASGNVRWRLTSVGISAIHFDDKANLYVSTSSAGAESLKYSDQIDLSKRVVAVIMKVDPRNGKILWQLHKSGSEIYSSGKYLYTTENVPAGGMRIYRLNPRNGEPLWEHYEKRYTKNRDFQKNTIELLYDDELQVLHFLSL
jgi:hypothetical protein